MFCAFCGSERSDDALFCHKCGRKVFVENIEDVHFEDAVKETKKKIEKEPEIEQKKDKKTFIGIIVALIIAITAFVGIDILFLLGNKANSSESDDNEREYSIVSEIEDNTEYVETLGDNVEENFEDLSIEEISEEISEEVSEEVVEQVSEEVVEEISAEVEEISEEESEEIDEGHSDLYISQYKEILKAPKDWLEENEAEVFKAKKYSYGLYNVCGDSTPELLLSAGPYKEYKRGKSVLWYIISCNDEDGAYIVGTSELGVTETLEIYNGMLAVQITNGVGDLYIEKIDVKDGQFVLGDNIYTGSVEDDLSFSEVISVNYDVKKMEPFDYVQ